MKFNKSKTVVCCEVGDLFRCTSSSGGGYLKNHILAVENMGYHTFTGEFIMNVKDLSAKRYDDLDDGENHMPLLWFSTRFFRAEDIVFLGKVKLC